jgi:hypothetical protein
MSRGLSWLAMSFHAAARRSAWATTVPFRGILARFESSRLVERYIQWAQRDNFPFFQRRPIEAPILHFLCTDEPEMVDVVTRFGWRKFARRGIDERTVPLDHNNLLHESNLPAIGAALVEWCDAPLPPPAK